MKMSFKTKNMKQSSLARYLELTCFSQGVDFLDSTFHNTACDLLKLDGGSDKKMAVFETKTSSRKWTVRVWIMRRDAKPRGQNETIFLSFSWLNKALNTLTGWRCMALKRDAFINIPSGLLRTKPWIFESLNLCILKAFVVRSCSMNMNYYLSLGVKRLFYWIPWGIQWLRKNHGQVTKNIFLADM